MRRSEADQFLEQARLRLGDAQAKDVPAAYVNLLESHFHSFDRQRTDIPLWPCNVNLVPAPAIRAAVGPESYRHLFYSFAEHFWLLRYVCGFRGDQHLLDVGCGCGKTALALLRTIRPPGSYTGFDIQPNLIEFMQRLFAQLGITEYFRADCFPITNEFYRGAAQPVRAEDFEFPYEASRFDCAFLGSVFTHMLSEAVANYARNLARVVRAGGQILVSAFLLDNSPAGNSGGAPWADSPRLRALQEPSSVIDQGRLKVLKPENPAFLVAYRLQFLTATFKNFACELVGEPLWGSWSGRSDFFGYQDYLVFRREAP
jgi:SAM-dependent methyltransferase